MSITHKTALAMATVLLVMTAVVYAVSTTLMLDAFREVEAQDAKAHVGRASQALNATLAALSNMTGDWSNWDDVYQFIQDGNQEFVETNIHGKAFKEMDVDVMVFLDREGQVVLATAFSRETEEPMPVPAGLAEKLVPGSPLLLDEADEPVSGVMALPGGPLLIAARPALTSEYAGPARGTVVMGTLLDGDMVRHLEATTHLSLSLSSVGAGSSGSAEKMALDRLLAGETAVIQPVSDGRVVAYGLLVDVFGRPAYLLTVDLPRVIYGQGLAATRYFLAALVVISIASLAGILLLLRHLVLSRLLRLSTEVGAIGSSNDVALRVSPSGSDELGRLAEALNGALASLQETQEQLRASEARNRALVDAIPDALVTVNRDGVVVRARPDRDKRLAELCQTAVGRKLADCLPPDIGRRAQQSAAEAMETGQPDSFEFQLDVGGRVVDYEARVVMSAAEEALAFVRDVSERRQLEEARRNELLLREIHHRVKNNLQVISSLISLQSEAVQDPATAEMLRDSQNRVKSMALIHEKLYQSRGVAGINFGEYIRDLAAFLANSYRLGNAETSVSVNAHDLELGLDKAVPCGLIVNELVSNALKHAFPDGRAGCIRVDLFRAGESGVELSVSDDGVGLPSHFDIGTADSLGLRLVSSLADQIDASLDVKCGPGASFRLCFAA